MLKNTYVSRVFGHLFDLVRLVKPSAWYRTASTVKTSTTSILPSKMDADKKSPRALFFILFQYYFLFTFSVIASVSETILSFLCYCTSCPLPCHCPTLPILSLSDLIEQSPLLDLPVKPEDDI